MLLRGLGPRARVYTGETLWPGEEDGSGSARADGSATRTRASAGSDSRDRRITDEAPLEKRAVAKVMRTVGEQLGKHAAVARASYVSPAVVEQYLDGRTVDDFRPRHLRVVGARDMGLDLEEQALLSLLRSWRIRPARRAA
jgi:DNA topoisomerase IB